MQKRTFHPLTVTETYRLSPSVQRVTLQGPSLAQFGPQSEGGYVKLLFTPQGSADISVLSDEERPLMRTYTIRQYDGENQQITVDFVLHTGDSLAQAGFASHWAERASIGDQISIAGPGRSQDINTDCDWIFMAADMTALPALAVTLKNLPPETQGVAVVEMLDNGDEQTLEKPQGVKLIWINTRRDHSLSETVRAQPWQDGRCSVWCACEFETMRKLRQYFRNERDIGREHIYISSYWKDGVTEDGHKVIKCQDMEENQ